MMYLKRIPRIVHHVFPEIIFRVKQNTHAIYLTFDDGPHPQSTPQLLDFLEQHQVKASFFCTGTQVEEHPELFEKIRNAQHQTGNHGYEHLHGKKLAPADFLKNAEKGKQFTKSQLFRPPYGEINREQYRSVKTDNKVVLWTLMPGDFDTRETPKSMQQFLTKKTRPGSVVVLHDKPKTIDKLLAFLPDYIKIMREAGYRFETLPV